MAEIKAKKVLFKNRDGESLIPYIGEDYVKQEDMVEINMREVPCIVETYQNGTSWYRVYSDGWCEQGGTSTASSGTSHSVTLLKTMKDTNYLAFAMLQDSSVTAGGGALTRYFTISKTTTQLSFGSYTNLKSNWYVCGYKA